MEEDPMHSNKIRFHPMKLSKPRIEWPRIFINISYQTHGLLTHQTLILWIVLRVGLGVVEKEVNKHSHNTKSSSSLEAIAQTMEDINKGHLMVAYSHFRTRIDARSANYIFRMAKSEDKRLQKLIRNDVHVSCFSISSIHVINPVALMS
ncbi:hypothetical protein ACTXT7_015386 [Hymenolepis weldensis]